MIKPNTLCRNPNCTHGKDGKRNFYYSCRYCLRVGNWRSFACCLECYQEWQKLIEESRSKGKAVITTSERTDITPEQHDEIMSTPIEDVKKYTVDIELSDYKDAITEEGIGATIDKINDDIKNSEGQEGEPGRKKKKSSTGQQEDVVDE